MGLFYRRGDVLDGSKGEEGGGTSLERCGMMYLDVFFFLWYLENFRGISVSFKVGEGTWERISAVSG